MWALVVLVFFLFFFLLVNEGIWWVRLLTKEKARVWLSSLEFIHTPQSKKAVLLLHEFSGLPCSLEELGKMLYLDGWDVYIPAMPETVKRLEEVSKIQVGPLYFLWYEEAEKHLQRLRSLYSNIVVGGSSIGGSLAFHLASRYEVKAVFAVAAPYRLFGWHYFRPFLRNAMLFFSGWIGLFVPWWRVKKPFSLSSIEKRYGVDGIIWARAIHTQKIGLRHMRKGLSRIKAPCFLIQAHNDRTVSSSSLLFFMKALRNTFREGVLLDMQWDKESRHHLLLNHEGVKDEVKKRIVFFLRRLSDD